MISNSVCILKLKPKKETVISHEEKMASNHGFDMDASIISDISALECDDFDLIIEHLLCKPKKTKRFRKSNRKLHAAQSVPALNAAELFNTQDQVDDNMANATFSAGNTSYLSTFNDTINSEQFENIFAYFDQDVTTDGLLISDDEDNDDNDDNNMTNKMDKLASNFQNVLLNENKSYPKNNQTQHETRDIQNKSKAILNKIQQFNGIEPTNSVVGKRSIKQRTQNRPISVLSTSSTASLHDSDSESTFKKPFDVMNKGNVRSKVAFFNDTSSSERSSSASPSIQSISDDEEYRFQRTQSKHKFEQNCSFFENFFQVKPKSNDQSMLDTSTFCVERKFKTENQTVEDDADLKQSSNGNKQLDPHEKLKAVQTYVQTQFLLGRIQRLVTAISQLDEHRLSTMNLNLLKKFLTFIRDCSYNCTAVCKSISQNVLTDFEKSVMSPEELLYSALKKAHSAQV